MCVEEDFEEQVHNETADVQGNKGAKEREAGPLGQEGTESAQSHYRMQACSVYAAVPYHSLLPRAGLS